MHVLTLYVQMFCRVVVGLIFAISFLGKIRNLSAFQQAIFTFNLVPSHAIQAISLLVVVGEAFIVLCCAIGSFLLLPGFLLALVLLVIFCLALMSVLTRNIKTACNCFGTSEKIVSGTDLWRNSGIIVCTLTGCATILVSDPQVVQMNQAIEGVIALSAIVFVLILTQLGEIIQVFHWR